MNAHAFTSRVAFVLVDAARFLLPTERKPWADAMRAEVAHLSSRAALGWAFGCLIAAIKHRFAPMNTGTLRISRWVMLVETLGCFGPATLFWFVLTFGPSGIVRLNGDFIAKSFLSQPGGTYVFTMWCLGTVIGLIGPIGLYLGLRYVVTGRALDNRALGIALIAGPAFSMLFGAIAYFAMNAVAPPVAAFTVFFVIAPVAVIAHLMYLARPATSTPAVAAATA
jgi:hypothetical protein